MSLRVLTKSITNLVLLSVMCFPRCGDGIAPNNTSSYLVLFNTLKQGTEISFTKTGITTALVEQNAVAAPNLDDTVFIMDSGELAFRGTANEVLDNEYLRHEYLAI